MAGEHQACMAAEQADAERPFHAGFLERPSASLISVALLHTLMVAIRRFCNEIHVSSIWSFGITIELDVFPFIQGVKRPV